MMSIIMIFIIVHKDINIFISHCVHPWSYLPVTLILSDHVVRGKSSFIQDERRVTKLLYYTWE